MFSIVTPAYNAAPYIEAMLKSVQNQTLADWEVVVADDGSSDDTRLRVERMAAADSRIRLLPPAPNSGGCFVPRMRAAEAAVGEFIVPVDADDLIEPDYLRILAERLDATGADMADCMFRRFSSLSSPAPGCDPSPAFWDGEDPSDSLPAEDFDFSQVMSGAEVASHTLDGWLSPCLGATRREIWTKALRSGLCSGEAVAGRRFVDEVFSRELLLLTPKVAFTPARYLYRHTEGSITRSKDARWLDILVADSLLSRLMRDSFGAGSRQHALAEALRFHHYFDSLRVLNSLDATARRAALAAEPASLLRDTRSSVDRNLIRPLVSGRYMALFSLPLKLALKTIAAYDGIFGIKPGRSL